MKINKLSILILFSIFLLSNSFATTAIVVDQSGNFEWSNESVEIKVTGGGNVPKYSVEDLSENDTYRVNFNAIFLADDTNDDGIYDSSDDSKIQNNDGGFSVSLASSTWQLSDITENDNDGADFDITSEDLGLSGNYENASIQLRNHVSSGDATAIKFDVVLNNFDFSGVDDSVTPIVVFTYTLTSTAGNSASQDGNKVSFGANGYFESEPTATDDNGSVDVGMNTNNGGAAIHVHISYPVFEGELVHDPTMGVQASADENDENADGGPELGGEGELPFPFAFTSVAILAIPLLRRRS